MLALTNTQSFRNTCFHSLWRVHDFTHSLYIHYILLNLSVLGLSFRINDSGLFAWISLTVWSRTYYLLLALSLLDSSNPAEEFWN